MAFEDFASRPRQPDESKQAKSGPPRVLEIDPARPFVIDRARIYATLNGLMRRDIQDCTTKDLDHAADLLARLVALDELSTEPVGEMLDRLINHYNVQQHLSAFLKHRHQRSASAGAAKEFNDAMVAAYSEEGKGLDVALVRLHHKEHGGSEQAAIRAVAQSLAEFRGVSDPEEIERGFEALKKKVQRAGKKKR